MYTMKFNASDITHYCEKIPFKLGKQPGSSKSIFQTQECQKSSAERYEYKESKRYRDRK